MTRHLLLLLLLAACAQEGGQLHRFEDGVVLYALEIDAMLPSGLPICIDGVIALNIVTAEFFRFPEFEGEVHCEPIVIWLPEGVYELTIYTFPGTSSTMRVNVP
jgi:hypothetical protein